MHMVVDDEHLITLTQRQHGSVVDNNSVRTTKRSARPNPRWAHYANIGATKVPSQCTRISMPAIAPNENAVEWRGLHLRAGAT